ncbi:MAG TPA: hypothetical protein VMD08_05370 [Candidatus Baltobacteraceae bacterium]|nr:hypothetical protein [Candidatus Baltobacteraceae bacterium]
MAKALYQSATVTLSWVGKGEGSTTPRTFPRRAPEWLAICWDVACGWEHKACTEDTARALKAEHLRTHPAHRITVVRV